MHLEKRVLDQRAPVNFLELTFTAVFVAHRVDLSPAFTQCADRRVEKAQGFPFGCEGPVEPGKEPGHRETAVPDSPASGSRCRHEPLFCWGHLKLADLLGQLSLWFGWMHQCECGSHEGTSFD